MSELIWWRPYRTVEDVDVLAIDLSSNREREAFALGIVDRGEMERYKKFLVDGARRQFLLSRAAVRVLLADRLGCAPTELAFEAGENGKPHAMVNQKPAPISFNLSHSGIFGLLAISPVRVVGVDVEGRRDRVDLDGVARQVFAAGERDALSRLKQLEKRDFFFRLWTLKEALIKARGTGFQYNPARFAVPDDVLAGADRGVFAFAEEGEPRWELFDLGCKDFAAALAVALPDNPSPNACLT